jgi:hypothetical protein
MKGRKMATWRNLGSVIVLVGLTSSVHADKYLLNEVPQAGDCLRVQIEMSLSGEMRVTREGKPVPISLVSKAKHDFCERALIVTAAGFVEKSARLYDSVQASIGIGRSLSEKTLRPERRLMVAQRHLEQPLVYSPAGPLTLDELNALEHFDTLNLTGLLSGKEVAVGDSWKVGNTTVQALCDFEGLSDQNLTGTLAGIDDNVAHVTITGSANGIDKGAQVKMTVQAEYWFDLTAKRLTRLTWKQKDEREQGPASPASTVEATTTVTRAIIEQPESLSDVKLVTVPSGFEPPLMLTQVLHRDPKSRFDLLFGREWQVTGQSDEHLVLRLMDKGEFVAQATITPWTPAPKDKKHLTPDEFREALDDMPGWEATMELQAGEMPSEGGRWIYRISALGTLDGTEVMQNFYLIAAPDGQQIVLAFTLSPKQADRLGTRDLSMVGSVGFPTDKK